MAEVVPKPSFTQEGRRLEHKLAGEARRAINKMDISEKEKREMREMWFDYLLTYENEYKKYHEIIAISENELAILN